MLDVVLRRSLHLYFFDDSRGVRALLPGLDFGRNFRRFLLFLRHDLRPLFDVPDALQFYVVLYDFLLPGEFLLLLLVHPLLEVNLPLDLLQLLLLVPDALLQLLLVAADVLVLELQLLRPLGLKVSGLLLDVVFGGLEEHVACRVGLPEVFLELVVVDWLVERVLHCYFVVGGIEGRLDGHLMVLDVWLYAVVLEGEVLLHCLILKLDGGLDASFFNFRLHLHFFVLLRDDAQLVGLVAHGDVGRDALVADGLALLEAKAALVPAHGHTFVLLVVGVLEGGILLLAV